MSNVEFGLLKASAGTGSPLKRSEAADVSDGGEHSSSLMTDQVLPQGNRLLPDHLRGCRGCQSIILTPQDHHAIRISVDFDFTHSLLLTSCTPKISVRYRIAVVLVL